MQFITEPGQPESTNRDSQNQQTGTARINKPGQPESANRLATCWRVEGSIPTKGQDTPDKPITLSTYIVGFFIWNKTTGA